LRPKGSQERIEWQIRIITIDIENSMRAILFDGKVARLSWRGGITSRPISPMEEWSNPPKLGCPHLKKSSRSAAQQALPYGGGRNFAYLPAFFSDSR